MQSLNPRLDVNCPSVCHLDWEGCFNARHLGLPRFLARADSLDDLTPIGWAALKTCGVSTLIDLRNDDEMSSAPPTPAGVTRFHLPLDGKEDREFWDRWENGWEFGTPLYYIPHLRRFPYLTARVLASLKPGTVFYCGLGRDRTGMIAMIVQWLLGVGRERIIEDYLLSSQRLSPLFRRRGVEDHAPQVESFLHAKGTTLAAVCAEFLDALGEVELDCTDLRERFL